MDIVDPKDLEISGKKAYEKGDYLEAARYFESAANGFTAKGDDIQAAEMSNNQSVALLQGKDYQGALDAVKGTEEIFENTADRAKWGMAVGNRAAALDALDQFEDAEAAYTLSADLLLSAGGEDLQAVVMQSLSALQLRKGRPLEALASMQTGVNKIEHPSLKQRILKKLLSLPIKYIKG